MSTNPSQANAAHGPFTIEQFMKNIQNGILAAAVCDCGYRTFLAASVCPKCGKSSNQHWEPVTGPGSILTYCVTYVGPPELADITPYIAIIVGFGDELRISAVLSYPLDPLHPPEDLIGKSVRVQFIDRPGGKILGMIIVQ
jgi:uncharacterized OB-fold protein